MNRIIKDMLSSEKVFFRCDFSYDTFVKKMLTIDSNLENGFKITPKDAGTTELRILQVTDMHMGHIKMGKWQIYKDIQKICKQFQPDLVVNTGDLFCRCKPDAFLHKILHDFDSKVNLPWAFAWGNHDCENFEPKMWFDRLDQLEHRLEHLPHCLYKQSRNFIENYGPEKIADNPREKAAYLEFIDLYNNHPNPEKQAMNAKRFDGFYGGNYHIQVCNPKTGKPAWELFVMNSRRDHHIPPKALRWMQDQINSQTPKLPALVFFHVPPYEFEKHWDSGNAHGIKGERVCFELDRGEIHQVFKSFGTIKGCFVGHDHVNDYYVDVDGIKYCYGRKTGNLAYGGDWSVKNVQYTYGVRKIKPGASLITIKLDAQTPFENTWDHCSVFSDGTQWKADKMEDMGTIKK